MNDPREDPDIDYLPRWAYMLGKEPVDYAAEHVAMLLEVHAEVWTSRMADPATFPAYCIELTWEGAARRIVGDLMAAGWTAPRIPELMAGCDR